MRNYSKVLVATPIRGNQTVTLYTAGMLQSTGLHGGWLPLAGQSVASFYTLTIAALAEQGQ